MEYISKSNPDHGGNDKKTGNTEIRFFILTKFQRMGFWGNTTFTII